MRLCKSLWVREIWGVDESKKRKERMREVRERPRELRIKIPSARGKRIPTFELFLKERHRDNDY